MMTGDGMIRRRLADEAATERLAAAVASVAQAGDIVALWGGLGLGKTVFARAFIRARAGHTGTPPPAEVPSPTFTLVQVYDMAAGPAVWHFDLYRLRQPEEAWELGIEDAFASAIVLIEWPERLGDLLAGLSPAARLDVRLCDGGAATARCVSLTGHGGWSERLADLAASTGEASTGAGEQQRKPA
ncbi:MAG: tRNA (adenosine(37)-N6)-threonylcarbamoyltransferase complex ATPase subunit type 1 TsaE [Alphaproteobacteria bacterium]